MYIYYSNLKNGLDKTLILTYIVNRVMQWQHTHNEPSMRESRVENIKNIMVHRTVLSYIYQP